MIVGCVHTGSSPTTSLDFDFPDPPPEVDTVECEELLRPDDLETLMGDEPDVVLKSTSSCFWLIGRERIQLVINTSRFVERWRQEILMDFTEPVANADPPLWRAGTSVAIFADDRGMLIHGIEDHELAVDLLRLAFSRLR